MPRTVIVGAGIIGISTAYYLSQSSSSKDDHIITLLDPCAPASGASGKAAGFLSRNWTVKETSPLEELSFRLYKELAEAYGGHERWGYRKSEVLAVVGGKATSGTVEPLDWGEWEKRMRTTEYTGELRWIKNGFIQGQKLLGDPHSFAQWLHSMLRD